MAVVFIPHKTLGLTDSTGVKLSKTQTCAIQGALRRAIGGSQMGVGDLAQIVIIDIIDKKLLDVINLDLVHLGGFFRLVFHGVMIGPREDQVFVPKYATERKRHQRCLLEEIQPLSTYV